MMGMASPDTWGYCVTNTMMLNQLRSSPLKLADMLEFQPINNDAEHLATNLIIKKVMNHGFLHGSPDIFFFKC